MQILWSRSAQVRSCRCNSCLHAATALARRATTAASKRRLKASDVFTACYSAMFATAALADAKNKEYRRKQWDLAIEEVKTGLATSSPNAQKGVPDQGPEQPTDKSSIFGHSCLAGKPLSCQGSYRMGGTVPQAPSGVKEHSDGRSDDLLLAYDGIRWDILSTTKKELVEGHIRIFQLETLNAHVRQAVMTQRNYVAIKAMTDEEIKLGLEEEPANTRVLSREPKTRLHLNKMQEMVAKLVAGLLINTKLFWIKSKQHWRKGGFYSNLDHKRLLTERISSLQNGCTRLPRYLPADWEDLVQERKRLNKSILSILHSAPSEGRSIDIMVAEICYNLLIGNAPPCIHTYNNMIIHFTRLRRHDLAEVVVESFFEDSKFRANEQTISAILDHYTARGSRKGYRRTIERMRAINGDMRMRRRLIALLHRPSINMWAMTEKVIHRDGFLHQKATRCAEVFMSLARGALKFIGARQAVTYLKICVNQGHQFAADEFIKIAICCLVERNEAAIEKLLSALVSQWRQNMSSPFHLESNSSVQRYVFLLLQFCGIILSPSTITYVRSSQKLPLRILVRHNHTVFERWVRFVHLETIDSAITRSSEHISTLNSIVAKSVTSGESYQTISRLCQYVELNWRAADEEYHSRLIFRQTALDYLTNRLEQLYITLNTMRRELRRIVFEGLDSMCRAEYNRITSGPRYLDINARLNVVLSLRLSPNSRQPQEYLRDCANQSKAETEERDAGSEDDRLPAQLAPPLPDWVSKLESCQQAVDKSQIPNYIPLFNFVPHTE
jgi:hypothetical protein